VRDVADFCDGRWLMEDGKCEKPEGKGQMAKGSLNLTHNRNSISHKEFSNYFILAIHLKI